MRQIQSAFSSHQKFSSHRRFTIEHHDSAPHARSDFGGMESRWPSPNHSDIDRFHSDQLEPREVLRIDKSHRLTLCVDDHDIINMFFADLSHRLDGQRIFGQ